MPEAGRVPRYVGCGCTGLLIKGFRGAVWEYVERCLCFVRVEFEVMAGHSPKDARSSHMHAMGAAGRVHCQAERVGIIHVRQQ